MARRARWVCQSGLHKSFGPGRRRFRGRILSAFAVPKPGLKPVPAWLNVNGAMTDVPPSFQRWRREWLGWAVAVAALASLTLAGCAAPSGTAPREPNGYVVRFVVTRSADHAALGSASVPVILGSQGKVKIAAPKPAENQPVLPQYFVRLNRKSRSGVYELVTRVAVREAIRNKKGKLKFSQRFIGALVPARLGETQVVSAEGDPIHVEARLERR